MMSARPWDKLRTLSDLLKFLKPVPHQTFINAQVVPYVRTTYIVDAAGECTVQREVGDMMVVFTLPRGVRPAPTKEMLQTQWPLDWDRGAEP